MKNDPKFVKLYEKYYEEECDQVYAFVSAMQELNVPIARQIMEVMKEFGDNETTELLIDHLIEQEVLKELEDNGVEL